MFSSGTTNLKVRLTTGPPVSARSMPVSKISSVSLKRQQMRTSKDDALRRARRVQIVVAVFFLAMLKGLSSALFSRPQVTSLIAIWLCGVGFFVSTESKGTLHASQKTENKFWMGMASLLSAILLFLADDSPFRVALNSSGFILGIVVMLATTYVVHVLHKRSHRQSLENRSAIPKNKSYREAISALADEQKELDGLVVDVNESLARLESALIPGGFRRMFDHQSMHQSERKIVDIFRYATRAQLNYLVLHLNMNVVLYRVKNHFKRTGENVLPSSITVSGKMPLEGSKSESAIQTKTTMGIGADDHPLAFAPSDDDLGSMALNTSGEKDDEYESESARESEFGGTRSASNSTSFYEDNFESDLTRKDHRNALVELLARDRLNDLTTSARASLLDALQVIGMMRNPLTKERAQRWAANIILDTRGDQLSELKTITDAKGSVHSMHKLVYNDITDEAVRASLLSHFQANKRTKLGRKVLSDVDDTLISSGGRYPAGIDDGFPRHSVYPGAGAFYEALDRGVSGTFAAPQQYGSKVEMDTDSEGEEDWSIVHGRPYMRSGAKKKRVVVGNLVFLSARPHVYKDMAEKRVYNRFERMIRAKNLHAMPTLLPGDLESGQAYMLRGDFEPMARKKLRNMVEYHSIYPEFTHVFVCDNGQADVRAAELMKERLGSTLEAVYVHQVQPLDKTFGYSDTSYDKWSKMGIHFYKTFVGAATDACNRGLVEPEALRQVCTASVSEFVDLASIFGTRFPGGLIGIEEKRFELVTDLVKANEVLEARGYQVVLTPRALCLFAVGSTVHTRIFGEGFVRVFRPVDGVYEVALLRGSLIGYFTALELKSSSWGKSSGGLFPGNAHHNLKNAHVSIQVGARVTTPYGDGVVRRYRPSDQIFEVILTKWPALAFLREDDVENFQEPSARKRIWGLGKALMRRTFSSTVSATGAQLSTAHAMVKASTSPTPSTGSPTRSSTQVSKHFEENSRVSVHPFGAGTVVLSPRDEDNIMQVRFDEMPNAKCFIHVSNASHLGEARKSRGFGLPPMDLAARAVSILFRAKGIDKQTSPEGLALKPGTSVETPFGKGMVTEGNRGDGIVKVSLDWGAEAFLNHGAIKRVEAAGMTTRILSLLSRSEGSNSAPTTTTVNLATKDSETTKSLPVATPPAITPRRSPTFPSYSFSTADSYEDLTDTTSH